MNNVIRECTFCSVCRSVYPIKWRYDVTDELTEEISEQNEALNVVTMENHLGCSIAPREPVDHGIASSVHLKSRS